MYVLSLCHDVAMGDCSCVQKKTTKHDALTSVLRSAGALPAGKSRSSGFHLVEHEDSSEVDFFLMLPPFLALA